MQHFVFYTGKKGNRIKGHMTLEEDLVNLVTKNGCNLVISTDSPLEMKRTRLYELPSEGAINIMVSHPRNIEVANTKCNGLVTCLGFDEKSEHYQEIYRQLKAICEDYSGDRI